jgi:hypothetical protein
LSLNGLEPKFELSANWFSGIGHTTGISFSFSLFAGPCGLDDCKQRDRRCGYVCTTSAHSRSSSFLIHFVSLNAPILMACGLGHGWDIHRAMHNLSETCGIEFSVLLKQFWKEFAVEITRVEFIDVTIG